MASIAGGHGACPTRNSRRHGSISRSHFPSGSSSHPCHSAATSNRAPSWAPDDRDRRGARHTACTQGAAGAVPAHGRADCGRGRPTEPSPWAGAADTYGMRASRKQATTSWHFARTKVQLAVIRTSKVIGSRARHARPAAHARGKTRNLDGYRESFLIGTFQPRLTHFIAGAIRVT
jgi:hypothetical protein